MGGTCVPSTVVRPVLQEAVEIVGEPVLLDEVGPRAVDAAPQQLRRLQLVVGDGGDVLGERRLRSGERRAEAVDAEQDVLLRVEEAQRSRVVEQRRPHGTQRSITDVAGAPVVDEKRRVPAGSAPNRRS